MKKRISLQKIINVPNFYCINLLMARWKSKYFWEQRIRRKFS